MKKRSISDEEIALIKAMIARDMPNKEIQFFFNRPERSVNSGRISGIKSGGYSNSLDIPAADDQILEEFLENFKATKVTASVQVPSSLAFAGKKLGPIDTETIQDMFECDGEGNWFFRHGESIRYECKENFGFKYSDKWLKAIAALANNIGGYVVFGVKDKSSKGGKNSTNHFTIVGMKSDEFEKVDPSDFTKKIKSVFDPTPIVTSVLHEIDGMKVGILHVDQHPSRPVIALKGDGTQIKEGDIFFRYPGQSARIKYSDLRAILDERDKQARIEILPLMRQLLSLNPKDAMIADLAVGRLSDEKQSIIIGEELLDRINFIREGEFEEKEGSPTLRLIGDVQSINKENVIELETFVTPADLINDFFELKSPHDPKEYIRCAVEGGNGAWLPMHYYGMKAVMGRKDIAYFIGTTNAPPGRKKLYSDRVMQKNSTFAAASGTSADYLDDINSGKKLNPSSLFEASNVARAIAGLKSKPSIPLQELLILLRNCWIAIGKEKPSALTYVRKASARIDELYFSSDN